MLQTALLDYQFLGLLSFPDDGFVAREVDVGGSDVSDALVISLVAVVIDESPDLAFEVAGQIAAFHQNPVLHGSMPTLNLALDLRVPNPKPMITNSADSRYE
jgi:hypothetical protein